MSVSVQRVVLGASVLLIGATVGMLLSQTLSHTAGPPHTGNGVAGGAAPSVTRLSVRAGAVGAGDSMSLSGADAGAGAGAGGRVRVSLRHRIGGVIDRAAIDAALRARTPTAQEIAAVNGDDDSDTAAAVAAAAGPETGVHVHTPTEKPHVYGVTGGAQPGGGGHDAHDALHPGAAEAEADEPKHVEDDPKVAAERADAARARLRSCFDMADKHGVVPGQTFGSLPDSLQVLWADQNCDAAVKLPVSGTKRINAFVCTHLSTTHTVKAGQSWGNLPPQLQRVWASIACDTLMHHWPAISATYAADPKLFAEMQGKAVDELKALTATSDALHEESRKLVEQMHALPNAHAQADQCRAWVKQYGVTTVGEWGSLPAALKNAWHDLHCDSCHLYMTDASATGDGRPYVRTGKEETIAVVTGTTTRNVYNVIDLQNLALFNTLLLSLAHSVEKGFDYAVYVAYDAGDKVYDKPDTAANAQKWFAQHVADPLHARGISVRLHLVRFENSAQKPGPAFNHALKKAYDDGAHWFYRVNDDTELCGAFATKLTARLKALGPPYGATGPHCAQGNTAILTHDFTHRTHLDIFGGLYYPEVLSDWWMDDWITHVYGGARTPRAQDVVVIHHNTKHGTRYSVDQAHGQMLGSEIDKGKKRIDAYAQAKGWKM